MNKWLLAAGVVLAGIVLTVPQVRANSTSGEVTKPMGISAELGAADFRTFCAACHGVSATGDGTIAEFLTIAAPDLTQLTKRNAGIFPRERVLQVIDGRAEVRIHGARDMPVWGDWFNYEAISPDTDRETRAIIVRERIESLVIYIESLQVN